MSKLFLFLYGVLAWYVVMSLILVWVSPLDTAIFGGIALAILAYLNLAYYVGRGFYRYLFWDNYFSWTPKNALGIYRCIAITFGLIWPVTPFVFGGRLLSYPTIPAQAWFLLDPGRMGRPDADLIENRQARTDVRYALDHLDHQHQSWLLTQGFRRPNNRQMFTYMGRGR